MHGGEIVGAFENSALGFKVQLGKIHAVPVVIEHQASGVLSHGLKTGRVFERHVKAPIHNGAMAGCRHFPPFGVLVPKLLAYHGIFQPRIDRDPLLVGSSEDPRQKFAKRVRLIERAKVNLAHRPLLQLRHHHGRINFRLAAKVNVDAEVVCAKRWRDVQLIHDGLSEEWQVLENHSLLRLQRNRAIEEAALPAASRNHQR
jgi:hypothetical protein